jgi:hypothetical protein
MNHAGDHFGSTGSDPTNEQETVDLRDCSASSLGWSSAAIIE